MDQAALQRVTLARPCGTLFGTARGAREQQRLRTWIECPFSESVASRWPTRWVSGSLFWISCWTPWLRRCNALQVWYWDEEAREAPEQFCRIFPNWAPCNYARSNRLVMPQRFADSAFCDRIVSPLTWYIIHGCPVWIWCVTDVGWSPTVPYVTVPDTATELLPGRGAVLLQVSC